MDESQVSADENVPLEDESSEQSEGLSRRQVISALLCAAGGASLGALMPSSARAATTGEATWVSTIGTAASPGTLRTLASAAERIAVAGGFWSEGDGGGGVFYSYTDGAAVDNGGTIIVGAGGIVWKRIFDGPLDIRWFGARGDGSDDTFAFTAANAAGTHLFAPKGMTFSIQNWTPLANTTLSAYGVTLQRFDNVTTYGATGSMSALIITNSHITILGGTHRATSSAVANSGSILIENGTNITIRDAEITASWGGIFGHAAQNGVLEARNVLIDSCTLHDCAFNTSLADIDGLTITNCRSYNASRNGITTARNVRNISIIDNFLYDNGNADAGQSRDGIDLYIAGHRCVIKGNHIYGNRAEGIDIRRAAASAGEAFRDAEYIISGNYIRGNSGSGILISADAAPAVNIQNVTIADNHVFSNSAWGISAAYVDHFAVHGNQIYSNGSDGIRVDNCSVGVAVRDNTVYDNGVALAAGARFGINLQATVSNALVSGNHVYSTAGSVTQEGGISSDCASTRIFDNLSTGHSGRQVSTLNADGNTKGKTLFHSIDAAHQPTRDIAFSLDRDCQLSSLILTVNGTGNVNVLVEKRTAAGAVDATLVSQNGLTLTGYIPLYLALTADPDERTVLAGRSINVQITNVSNGYTSGGLVVNYID